MNSSSRKDGFVDIATESSSPNAIALRAKAEDLYEELLVRRPELVAGRLSSGSDHGIGLCGYRNRSGHIRCQWHRQARGAHPGGAADCCSLVRRDSSPPAKARGFLQMRSPLFRVDPEAQRIHLLSPGAGELHRLRLAGGL